MQRLLLDTHVFLWWLADNPCLNHQAREAIGNGANQVFVSAATSWEIAIKKALGKLEAPDNIDNIVEAEYFSELPISILHGEVAGNLPPIHKDPFDRMLVAQAQTEDLIIVTKDPLIFKYNVKTLKAD